PKTATRSAQFPFIYNPGGSNTASGSQTSKKVTEQSLSALAAPSPYNLPPQLVTPFPSGMIAGTGKSLAQNSGGSSESNGTSSNTGSGNLTSDPNRAPDTPVTIYFQDP